MRTPRPEIRVPLERHASYEVAVDNLRPGSIVYSFGIGRDLNFEKSLAARTGATIHAFDPSPESVEYWGVIEPPPSGVTFHPTGVAAADGLVTFFPPAEGDVTRSYSSVENHSAGGSAVDVPVRRVGTLLRELGHDRIDLLKLDVEGSEYAVLEDVLSSDIPVSQIVVEFHHRFPSLGIGRTRRVLRLLRAAGFRLAHASQDAEDCVFVRAGTSG